MFGILLELKLVQILFVFQFVPFRKVIATPFQRSALYVCKENYRFFFLQTKQYVWIQSTYKVSSVEAEIKQWISSNSDKE
jgi:hypothetical protein